MRQPANTGDECPHEYEDVYDAPNLYKTTNYYKYSIQIQYECPQRYGDNYDATRSIRQPVKKRIK